MKMRTLAAAAALLCTAALQGQTVIAYWNENSNALPGGVFGFLADPDAFPQAADLGNGSITVGGGIVTETTTNANGDLVYRWVQSFTGANVNSLLGDLSGGSIAIQGGTSNGNNGCYIQFAFSMKGYKDLVVSYATQRTNTGFNSQQWSWSTDGVDFTPFQTITSIPTSFGLITLDALNALDGVDTAYLRVTLTGATSNSGNNRFDNIRLTATQAAVPGAPIPELAGEIVGSDFQITCPSATGYRYQLQISSGLSAWANYGSPQPGTGADLVFLAPVPTAFPGGKIFYRVGILAE